MGTVSAYQTQTDHAYPTLPGTTVTNGEAIVGSGIGDRGSTEPRKIWSRNLVLITSLTPATMN
jgi:hypothetical protein